MSHLTVLLRARREGKGLTQHEVAEKLGFKSKMAWSLLERGVRELSPSLYFKVSQVLGIPVKDLITATMADLVSNIEIEVSEAKNRKVG